SGNTVPTSRATSADGGRMTGAAPTVVTLPSQAVGKGSHASTGGRPTVVADSGPFATATDATTNGTDGTNDHAQTVAAVGSNAGSDATQAAETGSQDIKAHHDVARAAIASIWRQSQAEKREYFGFIYRDRDGNYHATRAVPGVFMSVPQETAEAVLHPE